MRHYDEPKPKRNYTGLKVLGVLLALAFVITLAYIVGNRLSDEALGVLAGAVCGVGSAIPVSLLIFALSQMRRRNEPREREQQPTFTQPIVIPPQMLQLPQEQQQRQPATWSRTERRDFEVVGGDGR